MFYYILLNFLSYIQHISHNLITFTYHIYFILCIYILKSCLILMLLPIIFLSVSTLLCVSSSFSSHASSITSFFPPIHLTKHTVFLAHSALLPLTLASSLHTSSSKPQQPHPLVLLPSLTIPLP